MNQKVFKWMTWTMNYMMAFLMGFTVVVLFCLPWIVNWYIWLDISYNMQSTQMFRTYILAVLYISGICAFFMLNECRRIFKTCALEDPFIIQNITSLKRISGLSVIITGVFFTKIFVLNSFFTLIVIFVFIMAAMVCFVLAQLFESAVHFKSENDLTI